MSRFTKSNKSDQLNTEKLPYCPKCRLMNIAIERRINGDAVCQDCGYKSKWSDWETFTNKIIRKVSIPFL